MIITPYAVYYSENEKVGLDTLNILTTCGYIKWDISDCILINAHDDIEYNMYKLQYVDNLYGFEVFYEND